MTMNLLTGETAISETDLEYVSLTTHRVRYIQKAADGSRVVSITLDAVSSCGVVSKSYPILLLLAGLAAAAGLFLSNNGSVGENLRNGAFIAAIGLVIVYFLSRAVALSIASPGDSITVSVRGVKEEKLIGFIDAVEEAKLRYLEKVPVSARKETE
jgi:hypothetical protein